MDKEKQIEEMEITKIALSICKEKEHCINLWGEENLRCVNHPYCETAQTVKALYAASYRKQSDVVSEFAKRIKDIIHRDENISNSADEYLCDEIDELAAEFGAEVEE